MALVRDYLILIRELLQGGLSATEFEGLYLKLFKEDDVRHSKDVFIILDRLFADVDAFCNSPELRGKRDLDEAGLKSAAAEALRTLEEMIQRSR